MVLVDTNVLVYLILRGDRTNDAQRLFSGDPDWYSESFVLIELTNVLTTYVRTSRLTLQRARNAFSSAEKALRGLVRVQHVRAMEVAAVHGVSAYDARFLAAAADAGTPLVTEDARLRAAAPTLTMSLAQALSGH